MALPKIDEFMENSLPRSKLETVLAQSNQDTWKKFRRRTLKITSNQKLQDNQDIASLKQCLDEFGDKNSKLDDREDEDVDAQDVYAEHLAKLGAHNKVQKLKSESSYNFDAVSSSDFDQSDKRSSLMSTQKSNFLKNNLALML